MKIRNFVIAVVSSCLGTAWVGAAGTAITSVTMSGGFVTTITASAVVYPNSQLAPGTSSGGIVDGNVTDLNVITDVDDFNFLNGFSMNNSAGNFWTTSNFGGLTNYADTNGSGFDFFVFERGGNDTLNARALYSIDNGATFILGLQVLIATANNATQWGGTGYSNPPTSFGGNVQQVFGTAFRITDLLDASGTPLTNGALIQNIRFVTQNLDPLVVLAVVPEPSAIGLSGVAVLCLLARRSRKVS